jgi:quercetin dioxygenase-like cupin family protein
MIHVPFDQAGTFAPKGHDGVVNRLLVGRQDHGVSDVGVWYGSFEPDGHSDGHVHEGATQVYVILSGSFTAGAPDDPRDLGVHDTLIVPAGEEHFIRAGASGGTVMVITSPTLR